MFELRISTRAEKQIKLLKRSHQIEIIDALTEIRENPLAGKPLDRNLNGRFAYRFGVYRIVYKVRERDRIVEILFAGHRSSVYN